MRILHLSDLHPSAEYPDYDDAWVAPRAALGGNAKFDAIVLSGDLSVSAKQEEYSRLLDFVDQSLVPLLSTDGDQNPRSRIIVVPGNHDVDWSAKIWDPVPISSLSADELTRLLLDTREKPRESQYRICKSPLGHLEIVRRIDAKYQSRFANFQAFLDLLYATPSTNHSPFDLTSSKHWSAHLFPELGVAFYGFNSCASNDCHWRGAAFDRRAVADAANHASRNAQNMLRVAVWHHGLSPEGGAIDALTPDDLARLVHNGFALGLHGHIHEDRLEVFQTLYQGSFVRLSVGTFGGDAPSRPKLVGRQIATLRLSRAAVQVTLWAEERHPGQPLPEFKEYPPKLLAFDTRTLSTPKVEHHTQAKIHHRTWELAPNGFAKVRVSLADLRIHDTTALAIVLPPFCGIDTDTTASTREGARVVRREDLADGRVRCVIDRCETKQLDWTYRLSAAFALHVGDDLFRRDTVNPLASAASQRPHVDPNEEVFSHTPQFHVEQLILTVQLPKPISLDACRIIVEQPIRDGGLDDWQRKTPPPNCHLQLGKQDRSVELVIDDPTCNDRYGIAVTLPQEFRSARSARAMDVVADLLTLTRRHPKRVISTSGDTCPQCGGSCICKTCGKPLCERGVERLNSQLREALTAFLSYHLAYEKAVLGEHTEWVVRLWDIHTQRLVTAFGEFAPPLWNDSFEPGHGAAGHAFRFATAASRVRRGPTLLSRRRSDEWLTDYEWVLCVPILDEGHRAIGILSIGSSSRDFIAGTTPGDRVFADLARRLAERDSGRVCADTLSQLDILLSLVSSRFWQSLSQSMDLDQITQAKASRVLAEFVPPVTPLPQPAPTR